MKSAIIVILASVGASLPLLAEPIQVSTVAELDEAVRNAAPGTSWADGVIIEIAKGEYDCSEIGGTEKYPYSSADKYSWSTSALKLDKPYLTIRSATGKAEDVILKSNGTTSNRRCFLALVPCRVENLTVSGFAAGGSYNAYGAGIFSDAEGLEVAGCVFTGLSALSEGGAIALNSGSSTFTGCTIANGTCARTAGVLAKAGSHSFVDCSFTDLTANSSANTDTGYPGAFYAPADDVLLSRCTFTQCNRTGKGNGGAVGGSSAARCVSCTFDTCSAVANGGGGMGLCFEKCQFINCYAKTSGAGVYNSTNVTSCVFAGSTGAYVAANSILYGCTISNNTTSGVISGGFAEGSAIVANTNNSGSAVIKNAGLLNCRIIANHVNQSIVETSSLTNCLIVGCTSRKTYDPASISASYVNCTCVDNTCGNGDFANSTSTAINCILVDRNSKTTITTASAAQNCIYMTAGKGQDPGVDQHCTKVSDVTAIKFVGAGVEPFALTGRSPAKDAGSEDVIWSQSAVDLIGTHRVLGARVDIGCYEYNAPGLILLLR